MKKKFAAKTNCPVCYSSETITKDNKEPERLVRCSNCESIYESKLKFGEVLTEESKEIREIYRKIDIIDEDLYSLEDNLAHLEHERIYERYPKETYEEIEREIDSTISLIKINEIEKEDLYRRIDEIRLKQNV